MEIRSHVKYDDIVFLLYQPMESRHAIYMHCILFHEPCVELTTDVGAYSFVHSRSYIGLRIDRNKTVISSRAFRNVAAN
jgi:hypothetical protein